MNWPSEFDGAHSVSGAPSGTGSHASTEPCGLRPTGFDPSREQILERIIRDTLWMACRYAHGRQSYAVGMYNDAARRAVAAGVVQQGIETFALDGSLSAAMSGLTHQEFAMAYHNWSSPNAIRTHVPRRDRDGSPQGEDADAASFTTARAEGIAQSQAENHVTSTSSPEIAA